jgi:hypothetical protein
VGRTLRRIVWIAGIFILLSFVLFVVNQTVQIVDFSSRLNPTFGTVVFWCLIALYGILVFLPISILARLPKPLRPPASQESANFPAYFEALRKRLQGNPHLKGFPLAERRDIEAAIAVLGKEADTLIKKTASRVFITTAVSQNGRLDFLLVLSAVSQMIWQIAHTFYQRPNPRDFVSLYANVAATAFFASELDDIDINEQLAPVLSSTLGSAALSVPGTALVVNSILTGSANAFLVLRVGIIAKSYCGALQTDERKSVRRRATVDATRLLGSVVSEGATKVSKAVWNVSKDKMVRKVSTIAASAKVAGRRLFSKANPDQNEPSAIQK